MAGIVSMRGSLDPTGGWSNTLRGSEHFPNPFFDMASLAMPEANKNALQWCEYIYQANGTYQMSQKRINAYFLTDLEVGALSSTATIGEDEKEKWDYQLNDVMDIKGTERSMDDEVSCYGNSFASINVPFIRFLMCPKKGCGCVYPLRTVFENPSFKFVFTNYEFHATCPKCRYKGAWDYKDEPDNRPEKLTIKRWSPHQIHILHCPFTEEVQYYWRIPEDYKQLVRQGRLFHLERVSKPVLEAIKRNQLFKFAPGVIYHMKEPTLSGIANRGWGISRLITNFRQVWYVQVLHRYNEAIALDYVVPFRLITPGSKGGSAQASGQTRDPLLTTHMGDFMGQVRRMLRERRRNPATWHTLPYPVEYQALGGEATQLAPRELLDQGLETLLNAAGTPVELYKGTMQLQTAPVSLRLFEATWYHLVHQNNAFLRWVVERIAQILSWEAVSVRHKRVTHADDMQRHMAVLQLMMSQAISQTTGLKALGIEWNDEARLKAEESRRSGEIEAEVQKEMEQSAFGDQIASGAPPGGAPPGGAPPGGAPPGGAPPGGGAPAGGGGQAGAQPQIDPATGMPMQQGPVTGMIMSGNVPQTPDDMMAQAESIAQQLLGMPESQKDSELRMLKQKNEVLHSLVKAKIDEIRGQAKTQGGAQLLAQQFGGGGAPM